MSATLPLTATVGDAGVIGDRRQHLLRTLSSAAPVTPCAVAWMDAVPFAALSASARVAKDESIAATELFVDVHAKVSPDITLFQRVVRPRPCTRGAAAAQPC